MLIPFILLVLIVIGGIAAPYWIESRESFDPDVYR